MTLNQIWNFLNQNLVSNIIGALIFGVIAAWIVHRLVSTKERQEIISKISLILFNELNFNKTQAKILKEIFDKPSVLLTTYPAFKTSAWKIITESRFIESLDASKISRLLMFYEIFIHTDILYQDLWTFTVGINSAMSNSEEIRKFLRARIIENLNQLHGLEPELEKLIKELK